MIKKYTVLLVLLLQAFRLFSQDEIWDVYMAQYEKGVGSIVINMSLKTNAPIKQLPYLLKTGVKTINRTTDGLPVQEEFKVLYKISDKIKIIVDSVSKNKLAGTFSYQCERNDYYYINDTTGLRATLESAYQTNFPTYNYSINIKEDQDWKAYLEFLYPNEQTYEYMTNEKVIINLTKQGDDLSKARQTDHWLYFKTDDDRNQFINYSLKENFKTESKKFIKDAELKYQLQISRVDKVNLSSISKITIVLRKKAKELNGNYDGWETFVVK